MPKPRIPNHDSPPLPSPPLLEPALFRLLDVLERVDSDQHVLAPKRAPARVVKLHPVVVPRASTASGSAWGDLRAVRATYSATSTRTVRLIVPNLGPPFVRKIE